MNKVNFKEKKLQNHSNFKDPVCKIYCMKTTENKLQSWF